MTMASLKAMVRPLLVGIGLGLLIAAAVTAAYTIDLKALQEVRPGQLALLASAVLGNVVITTTLYWVVTLSLDAQPRVSWWRHLALISGSSLLNYLPVLVRPGLVGRVAFLKARHNLPVRQSLLLTQGIMFVVGLAVVGGAVTVVLTPAWLRAPLAGVILVGMCVAAGPTVRAVTRRRFVAAWSWPLLRTADLLVWVLRLWLALHIVGHTLPFMAVLGGGAVIVLVNMLAPMPNALGVREWGGGVYFQLGWASSGPAAMAALVIDRTVEVTVIATAALIMVWSLRPGIWPTAARTQK